jgi:hypothetical protein
MVLQGYPTMAEAEWLEEVWDWATDRPEDV